jgi:hypothetical protein
MIRIILMLAVSGLMFVAGPGRAQEPPAENAPVESPPAKSAVPESKPVENKPAESVPESSESRFTFNRAQDGYVRLDSRSGQVSFCSKRTVGWACQLVPEDRIAFETEIARLQDENAGLRKQLLARAPALPESVKTDPPPPVPDRTLKLPNEATIDHMKSFAGQLWRRVVDMIVQVQKELLKKS